MSERERERRERERREREKEREIEGGRWWGEGGGREGYLK